MSVSSLLTVDSFILWKVCDQNCRWYRIVWNGGKVPLQLAGGYYSAIIRPTHNNILSILPWISFSETLLTDRWTNWTRDITIIMSPCWGMNHWRTIFFSNMCQTCLTCVSVSVSWCVIVTLLWCVGSRSGLQDSASVLAGFHKFLPHAEKLSLTGQLERDERRTIKTTNVKNMYS